MSDDVATLLRMRSSWLDELFPGSVAVNDLRDAADEIERLRAELVSMTDKFNRLKDAIPTTDEMTTPDFLATVEGAWILEWSQSQRQWHVGLMARTITRNRRSFLNGKPNDFVIIGIYPTASECSALRRYLDEGRESIDSQDNSTEENP